MTLTDDERSAAKDAAARSQELLASAEANTLQAVAAVLARMLPGQEVFTLVTDIEDYSSVRFYSEDLQYAELDHADDVALMELLDTLGSGPVACKYGTYELRLDGSLVHLS